MKTCKDCIHYELCFDHDMLLYVDGGSESCTYFKEAAKFLECPCPIGSEVYEMSLYNNSSFITWHTHKVVGVHLGNFPDLRGHKRQEYLVTHCEGNNSLSRIPLNKIGKTIFLTKDSLDAAIAARRSQLNDLSTG